MGSALTIGRVAEAAGVTRKAVRVYEAKGLLPGAQRSASGYRLYDEHDVELLAFIRRARALGLHLEDIAEVIAIREGGTAPCSAVRDLLDARIAEVDAAVADLQALRLSLVQTRSRARDCSGDESAAVCGIIEG